jgi:pimeloyl-ACP methyl ester carboxylesterase
MNQWLTTFSEGLDQGIAPVLFVHSFAGDHTHWEAALEHLRATRRAVSFDLSGHGSSPPAQGNYSIRRLAEDIDTVADAEGLASFVLVGHSLGAAIAAEYAGTRSSRVTHLVLVDAPMALPPARAALIDAPLEADPYLTIEQFWKQHMLLDAKPETMDRVLRGLRRLARPAAIELTRDLLRYDAARALRSFPGPKAAIMTPRNDSPTSIHNAVRGFTHAMVEGTSHWIHLDKPAEFNRVLDRLLGEVTRVRRAV